LVERGGVDAIHPYRLPYSPEGGPAPCRPRRAANGGRSGHKRVRSRDQQIRRSPRRVSQYLIQRQSPTLFRPDGRLRCDPAGRARRQSQLAGVDQPGGGGDQAYDAGARWLSVSAIARLPEGPEAC
jgi:hypothetical protein